MASPARTNEELNLTVVQRYFPAVTQILTLANYAVLYKHSFEKKEWEKQDIEGTLFVCQLQLDSLGGERYSVVIMNRRGLKNFMEELIGENALEFTDDFIIQARESVEGELVAYGFWIHQDGSTANARVEVGAVIRELAVRGEKSRREKREEMEKREEAASGVAMGRQLSLSDLFRNQRAEDGGLSLGS
ncbi:PH domain-like protein [Tothia fuscella]|uniref:PH domain-like protein n=1 Tax=Tothia fuscella TaxID=1048955 RepID=A0A9P4NZW1_9PEZI|nr:PH domain-like protein [Tothia fuscella]